MGVRPHTRLACEEDQRPLPLRLRCKHRVCLPSPLLHQYGILDNAAFHTSRETAQRIEATGTTRLFLSPSSPDFNPIKQDFAALKKRREYQETVPLDEIIKGYQ
ncbi:MAG: transposase [Nitrospira sp.]|nr:transposase [Nitrospira sp.]